MVFDRCMNVSSIILYVYNVDTVCEQNMNMAALLLGLYESY